LGLLKVCEIKGDNLTCASSETKSYGTLNGQVTCKEKAVQLATAIKGWRFPWIKHGSEGLTRGSISALAVVDITFLIRTAGFIAKVMIQQLTTLKSYFCGRIISYQIIIVERRPLSTAVGE